MQLIKVYNPFDRTSSEISNVSFQGKTIQTLVLEFLKGIEEKQRLTVTYQEAKECLRITVNNLIVPSVFWDSTKPRENDLILITPIVGKGDAEKQLTNLAILIVATYFSGGVGAAGADLLGYGAESLVAYAFQAAFIVGTGMLLNSMTPKPDQQFLPETGSWNGSSAYGWNPRMTQRQGGVIPKWYGTNRVHPNVIVAQTYVPDPQPELGGFPLPDGPGDSDVSNHFIQFLGAVAQGPIESFVPDLYKINDQSLDNFTDVTFEGKRGLIDQTATSAFSELKTEYMVNLEMKTDEVPIVWTTPGNNFEELEIEILFPYGIYRIDTSRNRHLRKVIFQIEISEKDAESYTIFLQTEFFNNESIPLRYVYKTSQTYTGSNYIISNTITINKGTQYDIRVRRFIFGGELTEIIPIESRLGTVREVVATAYQYPRLAYFSTSALATKNLSGSLTVSAVIEGAIVNVYDGSSWNLEFSDNPAWVLWDIFTRPVISGDGSSGDPYTIERYEGMTVARLDLVKFYELAQFCDDLVDDGKGGTEKRITFNGGFDTVTNPWQAANKVCEIARCQPYWNGSVLTLAIDKATSATQLFTVSNIRLDSFKRTFFPDSSLASEIEIHYRDASKDYIRVPTVVFDPLLTNEGSRVQLDLFGTTKESEAWRAGQYRLSQNRFLKSIIEFNADVDAIACVLGDVIRVQHDVPNWNIGGLVVSGTATSVTVNKDLVYSDQSGINHEVLVRKQDGALNIIATVNDYEAIDAVTAGSKEFEVVGDHTLEFVTGDIIQVADSTGNDGDYTVSIDSTFAGGNTTITVSETVPDSTADGGLYNLRRIVVATPFVDADGNPSAPQGSVSGDSSIAPDVFAFGVENVDVGSYRLIGISRSSDSYFKLVAIEYDARIYDPDSNTPIIPMPNYELPVSDTTPLATISAPITQASVRAMAPIQAIGNPNIDVPTMTNLAWTEGDSGDPTVSWGSEEDNSAGTEPAIIVFQGISYEITEGSTLDSYIYWDEADPNVFNTTNTLLVAVSSGRWMMAVVDDYGGVSEAFARKIIHGGLIQADTITADFGQIADLTVGTLKIQDNAVTVPTTSHVAGAQSLGGAEAYVEVGTANVDIATSEPILITFNCIVGNDGAQNDLSGIKVLRDAVEVWKLEALCHQVAGSRRELLTITIYDDDDPGVGNYDYSIQLKTPGTQFTVALRTLYILQVKK